VGQPAGGAGRSETCVHSGAVTQVSALFLGLLLLAPAVGGQEALPPSAEVRGLLAAGENAAAEATARAAVERLEGTTDPALAEALDLLVEVLLASGRGAGEEAVALAERAVELRQAAGASPSDLASSQARLGRALTDRGDLDRAEAVLGEAEATVSEGDAVGRARVLNGLGALRRAQGKAGDARQAYAAALDGLDRSGSPWGPEVEQALVGLSSSLTTIGDHHAARRTDQRLLDGRLAAYGEGTVTVAFARRNLARDESSLGNLDAAEALHLQALATLEARLGSTHREVALTLNGLAVVARKRGDLLEARRQLERALAITEQLDGPRHPQVAGLLNNLGNVLRDLGDLPAAREAYERALAIREGNPATSPLELAQSLSNLGGLLCREENLERAIPLLERALAIREEGLGPGSRVVALTLVNLGDALLRAGRLERAREVLERAVALLGQGPHPDLRNLAVNLNNLGLVLLQQERLAEAATDLDRARAILEPTLGHDHLTTAKVMYNQARPLAFLGQLDAALGLALEAARVGREHVRLTSAGLSEREALAAADELEEFLDLALSLATEPDLDDPTLVAATWHAVIRSRGLILDEMASRRRWLSTPDNAALAEALRAAAGRLSRLLVEGSGSDAANEVDGARRDLERAERALAEASLPFARETFRAEVGLAEVTAHLPPRSALVAYVRFQRGFTQDPARRHAGQEPWYAAFLLAPDGAVEVVPLAEAAVVEALVGGWRTAASRENGAEAAAHELGSRLRATIWDPVAARLGDTGQVYVVPDGELALVNLAALPVDPMRFLVERGPLLVVLDHERDLVPEPLPGGAGPCLLALGDPAFDAPAGHPREDTRPAALPLPDFAPLSETSAETDFVASRWMAQGEGFEAVRLTGVEASEAAFKALAPGFRVLHLATHGFFLDGGAGGGGDSGRGVGGLVSSSADADGTAPENPLRLSGLALAGANRRDAAAVEDGILTAEEIATLDLDGVEWAVLSACESGVGEASTREGVFGLRRSFRIAGARTVIMSLWAVEDQAARVWTTALYRARLRDGLSTAEAVRRASLEVLAARRARGESTHPASWAAFVASGDWR